MTEQECLNRTVAPGTRRLKIVLDLTPEEWEKLKDITSDHEDMGPAGEGWQSEVMISLDKKIQKAVPE